LAATRFNGVGMQSSSAGPPIIVAGRGRVGPSFASALRAGGHRVRLIAGHDMDGLVNVIRKNPEQVVLLAIPGSSIEQHAKALALRRDYPDTVPVAHLNGDGGLTGLTSLAARGNETGMLHPIKFFPGRIPPSELYGRAFGINATTPRFRRYLTRLARSLRGRPRIVTDEQIPYYRAAQQFAGSYVTALASEACGLLEEIGWSRDESLAALLPLLQVQIDRLTRDGLPEALSGGPIRRGDHQIVKEQVVAIGAQPNLATTAALYRLLGGVALDLARELGLGLPASRRMKVALSAGAKPAKPGR
jgi:predicted short-subunit dehydrogenase-like oxidoreductase (DUF2520 family)